MSCQSGEIIKTSTLPPPCYHCRPPRFSCPTYGCPPREPLQPRRPCLSEFCALLKCRQPPEKPLPPPTICIARPCPEPVSEGRPCFPLSPKIKPPHSSVRFCIQTTCKGQTYCPCYNADMPRCRSTY
ncbi:DBF4-type zinc finger-containing protein 2 homolog [Athalia rosae]|uniref:DBF4-type zinc finger-containing protein 2 homolog n=1 Tax=Athalia rosae TaxID=37344 RepID=UPI002033672C|nr:DBF4-type zinc finger-containing protein 2 homolog [Athalia rosae]